MGRNRSGLRKLSPDLIDGARDETAAQVTRINLTFIGTAAFCLLSLFSPDSGLVANGEKLTVPGAGPVSFFGFMLLGPTILILLRVYLQIYVEHSNRLDRIARRMPVVRAPTLLPLKNPFIRVFSALTYYLLLPLEMLFFTWKAAVFHAWGSALLCVTAGVIASHAMLPFQRVAWRRRISLSVGCVIVLGVVMLCFGNPVHRPFWLFRANLSNQLLQSYDFRGAELDGADLHDSALWEANFENARLSMANLSGTLAGFTNMRNTYQRSTNLRGADLSHADLREALLTGADLRETILKKANLGGADLTDANLSGADLSTTKLDGQGQLDKACGTNAKLPTGLNLKPCPPTWSLVNPLKGYLSDID